MYEPAKGTFSGTVNTVDFDSGDSMDVVTGNLMLIVFLSCRCKIFTLSAFNGCCWF